MVSKDEDLSGVSPNGASGEVSDYSNVLTEEIHNKYQENRFMRVTTFFIVVGLAIIFLLFGLSMARVVGEGILGNQRALIQVLTKQENSTKASENGLANISVSAAVTLPPTVSASKTTTVTAEGKSTGVSLLTLTEHQNWLSAGSLLTLVAFILGVGLTLLLTLIRNVFKAQEEESQRQTGEISRDIATPLSCLIEDFIAYMRKKLSS